MIIILCVLISIFIFQLFHKTKVSSKVNKVLKCVTNVNSSYKENHPCCGLRVKVLPRLQLYNDEYKKADASI